MRASAGPADLETLLREALAALRLERDRNDQLRDEVLSQGAIFVAVARALVSTHPDPAALRKAWCREIGYSHDAQASLRMPSDVTLRLQRVIESAFDR